MFSCNSNVEINLANTMVCSVLLLNGQNLYSCMYKYIPTFAGSSVWDRIRILLPMAVKLRVLTRGVMGDDMINYLQWIAFIFTLVGSF